MKLKPFNRLLKLLIIKLIFLARPACIVAMSAKKIYQYPIIFHFIILIIANMVVLKLRNFLTSVIIMLIILVMEKQEIVYHAENVK